MLETRSLLLPPILTLQRESLFLQLRAVLTVQLHRFVKAAARDVKAYLRARNSPIMVGYASADGETWRTELASYLTCGSEALSIDLYGLNTYSVRVSPYPFAF